MEIMRSLVVKLMDESNDYLGEDLFSSLDQEEFDMLEELINSVEFYIDIAGPLLVILIPLSIWWIRSRVQANRVQRFQ